MTAAALALYVVFLILALGLRSVVQYRRTGSTGLRIFSATRNPADALAGALIAAALIAGVVAPALGVLDVLDNVRWLDAAPVQWVGVAVACTGFVLVLLAQFHMGNSWRVGVDQSETTDLVTTGVFSVVRNPIFSAMLLFAFGLALMAPNVAALFAFASAVLGIELQVRFVEEPYLRATHGARYEAYAARTGRFAPRLGRAESKEQRTDRP